MISTAASREAGIIAAAAHPVYSDADYDDETSALKPLERASEWDEGELPETYPEGF